jgi:hypothetical protein
MIESTVRPASLADLKYIDHLQRRNADALAFYPLSAFEREIPLGRVVLAEVNEEPCGYLYHGAFSICLKIHQACIQYDLRGQLYGAAMVRWLAGIAETSSVHSITLRCGSDIDANRFWALMGFTCEAVTHGGIRRKRDINHWALKLQPSLFEFSAQPSDRQQDASDWRKRSVSLGSQFLRGKALKQYRSLVIQPRPRHEPV